MLDCSVVRTSGVILVLVLYQHVVVFDLEEGIDLVPHNLQLQKVDPLILDVRQNVPDLFRPRVIPVRQSPQERGNLVDRVHAENVPQKRRINLSSDPQKQLEPIFCDVMRHVSMRLGWKLRHRSPRTYAPSTSIRSSAHRIPGGKINRPVSEYCPASSGIS